MKIIAILEADLDRTPLGTRSRLADPLAGIPLLRRTIERLGACSTLASIHVTCPTNQDGRVKKLLTGLPARVEPRDAPPPPYRSLMREGRKWSLDGWRGGIGGACSWDEYTSCQVLASIAREHQADAVWTIAPASPFVDPSLADAMIRHYEANRDKARILFAQTPPGLSGVIYQTDLLVELTDKRTAPGWILTYKPDQPSMDLALKECCFPTPESVRHAAGRLIGDTDAAWDRLGRLAVSGSADDGVSIGRWLQADAANTVEALPQEVEIELTTEEQLPNSIFAPRGDRVGRRGPLEPAVLESLLAELTQRDDSRIVLGGFGEPLLHPRFGQILAAIAKGRPFAVALQTDGVALDSQRINTIIDGPIDVISVRLDAHSSESYRRVWGIDRFAEVVENISRLEAARLARSSVTPLVTVKLTKAPETYADMEGFVDTWTRKGIWPVIEGASHYAGLWQDHRPMTLTPPVRTVCRRLWNRIMILADATVVACDQDFSSRNPLGTLREQSLTSIWTGPKLQSLRAAHTQGQLNSVPLCPACDQWFR